MKNKLLGLVAGLLMIPLFASPVKAEEKKIKINDKCHVIYNVDLKKDYFQIRNITCDNSLSLYNFDKDDKIDLICFIEGGVLQER